MYEDLQQMLNEALSRPLGLLPDGTAIETEWAGAVGGSDWTA